MDVIETQRLSATVRLDLGELIVLNNALGAVLTSDDREAFLERVGTEPETVQRLLGELNGVAARVVNQ
jgi:hypothetical protein